MRDLTDGDGTSPASGRTVGLYKKPLPLSVPSLSLSVIPDIRHPDIDFPFRDDEEEEPREINQHGKSRKIEPEPSVSQSNQDIIVS